MKKLLCVCLALVMLLALAACGEKETVKSNISEQGTEPETSIFTVTIVYSDGEETSSRMTSEKEKLVDALIERTIMTEDMLTIGGEKADPEQNAYWTLYIDGAYATEDWKDIVIEGGVVYMFEYTVDMEYEEVPAGGDEEGGAVEETSEVVEEETYVEEEPEI